MNKVNNINCMPDIPYTLQWAGKCAPKLPPPLGGSGLQRTSWFPGATQVCTPNNTLIGPAIFCGNVCLVCVCVCWSQLVIDRHTHTHTHTQSMPCVHVT